MASSLSMASVATVRSPVVQIRAQRTPMLCTSSPSTALTLSCRGIVRPRVHSHRTRSSSARPSFTCSSNSHREQPSVPPLSPSALIATVIAASAAIALNAVRSAASRLAALFAPITEAEKAKLHTWGLTKMRLAGAAGPLCFAAISQAADSASSSTPLTVIASGMAKWLELYSGLLLIRVLLSWFPNIDWERQPLQAIRDMSDPYLNLFRNIMPPFFGALDLSPMLAFLVLGMLTSLLNTTIYA